MVLSGELDEQGAGRQRHRCRGGLSRIRVSLGAVGSGAQSRGLAMSSNLALCVFDPLGAEWFLMISLTPKRGRVTLSPLRQRGTGGPRRGEMEYRHFPLPSGAKARPGTEVAGGRTGWAERRQVGAGSTPTSCSPLPPPPSVSFNCLTTCWDNSQETLCSGQTKHLSPVLASPAGA